MIAALTPDYDAWPYNVRGVLTAHSERLDALTHVPESVRQTLDAYLSCYSDGRVIGGTLSPELVEAGRVLCDVATDYGALAAAELEAISPEEQAATWKQVKAARRAEELARTKGGTE